MNNKSFANDHIYLHKHRVNSPAEYNDNADAEQKQN